MSFQHRHTIPIFISSVFMFAASSIQAADLITIDGQHSSIGSGNDINAMMKLSHDYYFKSVKNVTLPNGKNKHKMTQYYLTIPVWGVSLAATQSQTGEYSNLSGRYLMNIKKDLSSVTPTISKKEALSIAIASKKISSQLKSVITQEEVNTFVMQDTQHKARLVYQISFMINNDKPSRPHFIMDAKTGEIVDQWDGLTTRDAIGPGGNQKTGQYNYGTDYGYLVVSDTCQMISPNVDSYDMKHLTSGGTIHQFDCTGNPPINAYQFINGAFSPINDAHYFGNVVFNMYNQWFNQSPLTMKLKMRVHYNDGYENAFWDGQQMTFGDGATHFYPLVSLDVVGHEVSHGFTEQHADLNYYRQPGGINEAFSDMAGEATKYFNNPNKPDNQRNDWLVGASIMKNGVALRYFADPTKDGRSIGNARDYYDGLDVHYSSGVFNKAFYTLGTKTNWNTEKAFRTFVLANQIYWHQNSDFIDAACGVKKAAQDLNYSTQDVIDAFNTVGVDASCNPPSPPLVTELKKGIPIPDLSGIKGNQQYYFVDVPAEKPLLTIKISGGTGDADLYVNYGKIPTTALYQCRPYTQGNNETCTFNAPKAGKYYVMLRAYANYSSVTLKTTY